MGAQWCSQAVSPDIFKAAETGNITELNAAVKAGMSITVEDKVREGEWWFVVGRVPLQVTLLPQAQRWTLLSLSHSFFPHLSPTCVASMASVGH